MSAQRESFSIGARNNPITNNAKVLIGNKRIKNKGYDVIVSIIFLFYLIEIDRATQDYFCLI